MRALSRTGMLMLGWVVGAMFMLHCGGSGSDGKANSGHRHAATEIDYDNVASGLTGVEVQAAIDELAAMVTALQAQVATHQAELAALEARMTAVESVTRFQSVDTSVINGLTGPHLIIEGANVHIRSGSGATDDWDVLTGRGNLVVGHNEEPGTPPAGYRLGSHNLIVGVGHGYMAHGGSVAGVANTISGVGSSVSGGTWNTASGSASWVGGGQENTASGHLSSVSGGHLNTASGTCSGVSGGEYNTAGGWFASITGGQYNTSGWWWASVTGGQHNAASGYFASVTGGSQNTAGGDWSSVSGGTGRSAPDTHDWAAGTLLEDF